ncbi:hypothetical protein WA026_016211 [Henosepilachna vigintioctopunctata]|uniref:Galactosylgalactosylxylosylprotein 3-beta-glucuronosyltransferase n=1 Tax=Henosepilachna vigintioctopunctata TaxID=420089 RepID=A0AAW1TL62_9CUCU
MKRSTMYFCMTSVSFIFILWKIFEISSALENTNQAIIINKNIDLLSKRFIKSVTIYCVTPTYWRYVQKAELVRVYQTLTLASFKVDIKWIVVEDSEHKTDLVSNLLKRIDNEGAHFQYVHLNAKTPPFQKLKGKDPRWKKHRGVEQRNAALKWIRDNVSSHGTKKIVYFMDDDNTYDVKLFEELTKIENVGVWPVGLVGGLNIETPILDPKTGKVASYKSGWKPDRPFAIDMAGFGINVDLILSNPEAVFSYRMEKGFQESQFLAYFTTKDQLEPLASNCTEVYVWHTRTEKPDVKGIVPGYEV